MPEVNQKKLMNTTGFSYYGADCSKQKVALATGYLESNFKISIHKELPENERTSGQRFNYKVGPVVHLSGKKAKLFAKLVKKCVVALQKDEDFEPQGVTAGNSLIEVSDGSMFGLKSVCITICSDIDKDTKVANLEETFVFDPSEVIANYNSKSGTWETKYDIGNEVESFILQLEEFYRASTCAEAHFTHKELSYSLSNIASRQIQIMDKMGIKETMYGGKSYSSGGSWNKSATPSSSTGSSRQMSPSEIMKALDDSEDYD